MRTLKEKSAGLTTATDLDMKLKGDYTVLAATCNKWLAIWRYCHGYLSHSGCEAEFRAHTEWRAA